MYLSKLSVTDLNFSHSFIFKKNEYGIIWTEANFINSYLCKSLPKNKIVQFKTGSVYLINHVIFMKEELVQNLPKVNFNYYNSFMINSLQYCNFFNLISSIMWWRFKLSRRLYFMFITTLRKVLFIISSVNSKLRNYPKLISINNLR